MPGLSEFVSFVAEKSGVKDTSLIELDIILHRILKEFCSSPTSTKYLFKGGSCLTKCYLGYYRFSVDLDFTWKNQETWTGLGEKELRRELLDEIKVLASFLEKVSEETGLRFKAEHKNRNFVEFGGGGRMVTFKLWKNSELIKIQVNFIERLLFPPKKVTVKTLLDKAKLSRDEKAYFEEFLGFYRPLQIMAYDGREILCEKVRAILTRRVQKLRDFYDLFMLSKHGYKIEDLIKEIIEKTRASLYYKKYRSNLEENRKELKMGEGLLEDPFERRLLIEISQRDFEDFLKVIGSKLKEIANSV
ncbi:MAG: nucleotidyl transferase AbiEii/AbiGii toxin family protein [Candidatus Bathyarchaeia archaeon]